MDSHTNCTPRLAGLGAVVLVVFLGVAPARADVITPDSIPHPPPTLPNYVNHAPIPSPAYVVSNQYAGQGLQFPALSVNVDTKLAVEVSTLGGAAVWVPGYQSAAPPWQGTITYDGIIVQFVKPGSNTATTASSVTVEVINQSAIAIEMNALNPLGKDIGETITSGGTGPHGGELLTLSAPDIREVVVGFVPNGDNPSSGPWGIAGIEFTPTAASAPEPCGLALAAMGMAALAGCTLRRRRTPASAP